ncbi:ribonuclease H-like domain-containing protein [Tanacetum coccineum]
MDLESTQNNALAKLPLLKQGDYDTWRLRIESYIQLQDYALWEIIEDGNSFKPVARTTTNADGTSTSTIPGAVTADEKIQKKNDLKAQSILMMTLPSEHLLTFNQYKDAKTLFEAIEARFGGNEATKKTQKTLLKQMYENFNASSSESLDSIFTRLQKIVSQLAILDMSSISFDDLYNNFKIVEQEVKRSITSSSNSNSHNVAFVSTPSSTNGVNKSNVHVNTASSSLSTASSTDNNARLSDATIYAFLANQPNGFQVVHEDLEQIHEDDLEEIDLKWKLALLSIKARKFYQRTGKKIIINGSDTAGYDKTKIECFNCHKMGHFARYFMTEEKTPTNFALMAFSDSEVHNNKTCTKIYLKSFKDLRSQYDNLRIDLNKSEFDLANYKRGLASVEEQLVFYKKNEGMLCDQIVVLKRDASFNESEINALKIQIERLKKEKESNQFKIENFENASKSLDKLIGSQISNNNRKGVGYNAVPPPPTGLFVPPTIDLSNSGLEEFKVSKSVSENSSNEVKKTSADQPRKISQNPRNNHTNWNTPMSKKLGVGFQFTPKACFVCGSFNHLIKDCDFHDKKMVQKPVLNNVKMGTGQREVRPVWNNAMRTNHQNFSNSRRNFAPTAVLTKSGLVPISTTRQNSSRIAATVSAARPIKTAAPKPFVDSVNTAKGKRVTSVVGEQGIDAVKSKACWVWRPKLKTKGVKHIGKSKEVGTLRYLSLVVSLTKVGDEAVHKELGDRIERAATTASSFEVEQDSGGYTLGSDEGSKKLNELTELCIKLSEKEEIEYILEQITPSKEFLSTDEEIAQKLNEEEMTKAVAREGSRKYWKIIRVRDVIVAYQSFEDMLKGFDREDLVALWSLVKERFRFAESTKDMEKALWYISRRLQVEEDSEMARDLVKKIFIEANRSRS